jgi:phosphoglycolate phosphatase
MTILFDLDGTIIEPQEGILNSIRHAAQKMGVDIPAKTEMHQFIGPPIMDSFQSKLSLNYEDAMQAVSYFRKYYQTTGIHQHQLFPYVEQLLNNLKHKGYNLFVATSKPTVFAKEILEGHQLDSLFTEIVGCNLDNSRSDKTEIIDYIVKKHNLDIAKTVMIGDTKYDIIGAKNHGMNSIGVSYGHGDFVTYIPSYQVDTCQELEKLIEKEFGLFFS